MWTCLWLVASVWALRPLHYDPSFLQCIPENTQGLTLQPTSTLPSHLKLQSLSPGIYGGRYVGFARARRSMLWLRKQPTIWHMIPTGPTTFYLQNPSRQQFLGTKSHWQWPDRPRLIKRGQEFVAVQAGKDEYYLRLACSARYISHGQRHPKIRFTSQPYTIFRVVRYP